MSEAWSRLGFIRHRGQWITRDELGTVLAREAREAKLFAKWRNVLQKYRADLNGDNCVANESIEYFSKLNDPEAAPAIWSVLVAGGDRDAQFTAIDVYRRLDAPSATRHLAAIAVLSPWNDVRAHAVKFLVECDQDVVVGTLLSLFRDPLRYDVQHVGGPGSPGASSSKGKNSSFNWSSPRRHCR